MRLTSILALIILNAVCLPDVHAQLSSRDRNRDGGDRGRFGGRTGGERGGPPGGFGSRLDQNGDGRIDQEELNNIPEGFRQAMQSRGIRLRPGLTVEEFSNNIRQQFERSRAEGGRPDQRRPEGRPDERSAGNKSQYRPPAPFRQRQKERLTLDLPPKYNELDTDYDGQVGLYEWITARRENLQQFDDIDVNSDGVLTPQELMLYDNVSTSKRPTHVSFKRDRVTIIGGPLATATTRRTSERSTSSSLSDEVREKHADFARTRAFPYLDVNKDGRITMEELHRDEKTRRVIQTLEKAEIRVEAMSQKEFADRWVAAQEVFARRKEETRDKQKR